MIRIGSITLILVILTFCANGLNSDNRYLKNGIGTKYGNDKIGPALTIEYSQNLSENIALVPRIQISTLINDLLGSESESMESYYDFGLGLYYRLPSLDKIAFGAGINSSLMQQTYIHEYLDINNNTISNIVTAFDVNFTGYCLVDYSVFQTKKFDFGIDGTFQFGKHDFYTVNIYYRFTF